MTAIKPGPRIGLLAPALAHFVGTSRCVYARARQAHQTSKPRGHPLGRRGPHATELRADEEASRDLERDPPSG
jgi:hypothetical protein